MTNEYLIPKNGVQWIHKMTEDEYYGELVNLPGEKGIAVLEKQPPIDSVFWMIYYVRKDRQDLAGVIYPRAMGRDKNQWEDYDKRQILIDMAYEGNILAMGWWIANVYREELPKREIFIGFCCHGNADYAKRFLSLHTDLEWSSCLASIIANVPSREIIDLFVRRSNLVKVLGSVTMVLDLDNDQNIILAKMGFRHYYLGDVGFWHHSPEPLGEQELQQMFVNQQELLRSRHKNAASVLR